MKSGQPSPCGSTTAAPYVWILQFWPIAAAVFIAASLLLVFQVYVPLNMDEFVSYQTLACFYHPNGFAEAHCYPCTSFYLKVLGTVDLPLLSYDYIGSLSSLLYAPIFLLWPEPISARATGILALAVQAWLLGKLFGCRPSGAFCCLALFLPYSFVHIADTGPVALQVTSVYAVAYLIKRWRFARHPGQRSLLLSLAGALIACGFWVKPTLFFASGGIAVLAGVALISALATRPCERAWRAAEFLLFTLCAAGLTLLVYQAQHAGGAPYLAVLGTSYVPSQIVLSDLGTRLRENVLPFVLDPLNAATPCFNLTGQVPVWGALTCAMGAGLIASGLATRNRPKRHRVEIALLGALFIISLLLVATNLYAKSMHHAVLAYPFVIMAAARCVCTSQRAGLGKSLLALFIAMNACLLFRFPAMFEHARQTADPKAFSGPLNVDLNASRPEESVVLCADWGLYFIQRLYGPRSQIVLSWCSPEDVEQLQDATNLARAYGRDLAVVLLRSNTAARDELRRRFSTLSERTGGETGSPWLICRIPRLALESPPGDVVGDRPSPDAVPLATPLLPDAMPITPPPPLTPPDL